jgi:hypothetical protein
MSGALMFATAYAENKLNWSMGNISAVGNGLVSNTLTVSFNSNGTISVSCTNGGTVTSSNSLSGKWLASPDVALAANYYVRVTPTGGTPGSFTSGATGSWLSLNTTRTFTRNSAAGQAKNVIATVEFSLDQSTVLASSSCSFGIDNT